MKQLTLTAFYGQKEHKELRSLIEKIWKKIEHSKLRRVFKKYHLNQVHSTLIGMEKVIGFEDYFNANTWEIEGRKVAMNFSNLNSNINAFFPMTIQFGGFSDGFEEFKSHNEKPYDRAFKINWNSKKVILMGWSMKDNSNLADSKLIALRQELYNKNNIRHKYNDDNDFYLVLGQIENIELLDPRELDELIRESRNLEHEIRSELAGKCRRIIVGLDDLSLVSYESERLELNTSEVRNIRRFENNSELIYKFFESI